MNNQEKDIFLSIRMKGKLGRGDATPDEMEFLAACRKEHPGTCSELEEEVRHRAMESMNPFYVRPVSKTSG